MTRSLAASRPSTRRVVSRAPRPARDPRFTRLSFTCFRLVPIGDPEPGELPFATIELMATMNAMGAFMLWRRDQ